MQLHPVFSLLLLLTIIPFNLMVVVEGHEKALTVSKIIKLRLEILRKFASSLKPVSNCPSDIFLNPGTSSYGNTGNNIIELTHGLWVARQLNATFIMPKWIKNVMSPFNMDALSKYHCIIDDSIKLPEDAVVHSFNSMVLFHVYNIFDDEKYKEVLPPINEQTIKDISLFFLKTYALLWSNFDPKFITISEQFIGTYLNDNLGFTAVHKRSHEGMCSQKMTASTNISEFSAEEIPLNSTFWSHNSAKSHPLCDMPVDFVLSTQKLNHREGRNIFVAHDGQDSINDLLKHGAVSLGQTLNDKVPFVSLKYIDMFIAMNSDFFILNPLSTFSWQIYLIRLSLALESVPVIRQKIFCLNCYKHNQIKPWWVSWTSAIDSFFETERKRLF